MHINKVIGKYFQLVNTEDFVKYEKDFADKMQMGLYEGYQRGTYEPEMVSDVEAIINNVNGLSVSANRFRISTNGIFIHGNKSQVEFNYYGQEVQKEVGDLIFILSVIYNWKKYFEKITISQFKKEHSKLRWDIDKEQLYLLAHFPAFKGIKGIIPKKKFNLPNYSGCLGSFNLLFSPGDFVFVSATQLENLVGNRKSIDRVNLFKLWEPPNPYFIPFYCPYIKGPFYFWDNLCKHEILTSFSLPCFMGLLGYSHSAFNIYDFTDKYLRGYIGELTYSDIGIYNAPTFDFLSELLSAIKKKAQKDKKPEVINFINKFFSHPYGGNEGGVREDVEFDYEEGGIGIIYTSINLGEDEK